jgi:AmmeMemoRadiSam system protein A
MAVIPESDRQRLVSLARASLQATVRGDRAPDVPRDLEVAASGVFVSVYCRGDLRGCLGTLEIAESLAVAIVRLAAEVSHRDHRFAPIRVQELNEVALELSVLTLPELVADLDSIEVGRDGLIIEQGTHRGLLLPQVAVEHEWDRVMFLAQTCVKAGLRPDAWRYGATVWRFRADVFGRALSEIES